MKKFELKPYQKVLVRDYDDESWRAGFYSHIEERGVVCTDGCYWSQVVAYEGNEHLLGTTDPYVEPYRPKDGDFVVLDVDQGVILIYDKENSGPVIEGYAAWDLGSNEFFEDPGCFPPRINRRATEKEKQLLLSKLHEIGKDWDAAKKEIVDWRWKPTVNEKYYYVNSVFIADTETWTGNLLDEQRYKKGNCFRTHEECQAMCDKLNEAIKLK